MPDQQHRFSVLRSSEGGVPSRTDTAAWLVRQGWDARYFSLWLEIQPGSPVGCKVWLRALTRLHSTGLVDDEELQRQLILDDGGSSALNAVIEAARRQSRPFLLLLRISAAPEGAVERSCAQLEQDLAHLLDELDGAHVVIIAEPMVLEEQSTRLRSVEQIVVEVTQLTQKSSSEAARDDRAAQEEPVLEDVLVRARGAFVRATALAPYVSERLAHVLVPGVDARVALDDAVRLGLGEWITSDRGERVVKYTDEVRTYFGWMAESPVKTADDRVSAAVVARWLLRDQEDPHAALRYAVWSDDLDLVAAAGMRAFPFTQEAADLAHGLIQQLPAERRAKHPLLALWLGSLLALQPGGANRAASYFETADQAAITSLRSLPPTEQAIIVGSRAYLLRRAGGFAQAKKMAMRAYERADDLLQRGGVDPTLRHMFASVMHQVGVSLIYSRLDDEAQALFEALYEFSAEYSLGHRRNSAAAALAFLHAERGDLRLARRWLSLLRVEDWPEAWQTGHAPTFQDLAEMLIAALSANAPELSRVLERFSVYEDETEHWDIVLFARVCEQLLRGDPASAVLWFDNVLAERLNDATHPRIIARLRKTELFFRAAGISPRSSIGNRQGTSDRAVTAALRALIAARAGQTERAASALARAERDRSTPLDDAASAIAALVLLNRDATLNLDDIRARLRYAVDHTGLRLPLMLLSAAERDQLAIGDSLADLPVPRQAANGVRHSELTPQEFNVLAALVDFETRADIAAELHLSLNTVKAHLASIFRKLGVHSRAEALVKAATYQLIPKQGEGQ